MKSKLPINFEALLRQRTVEGERIECHHVTPHVTGHVTGHVAGHVAPEVTPEVTPEVRLIKVLKGTMSTDKGRQLLAAIVGEE